MGNPFEIPIEKLYTCTICHRSTEGNRIRREDRCKQCSLLITYADEFVSYNHRHPALDKYRPLPMIDALTIYIRDRKQWQGSLNPDVLTRVLTIVMQGS